MCDIFIHCFGLFVSFFWNFIFQINIQLVLFTCSMLQLQCTEYIDMNNWVQSFPSKSTKENVAACNDPLKDYVPPSKEIKVTTASQRRQHVAVSAEEEDTRWIGLRVIPRWDSFITTAACTDTPLKDPLFTDRLSITIASNNLPATGGHRGQSGHGCHHGFRERPAPLPRLRKELLKVGGSLSQRPRCRVC